MRTTTKPVAGVSLRRYRKLVQFLTETIGDKTISVENRLEAGKQLDLIYKRIDRSRELKASREFKLQLAGNSPKEPVTAKAVTQPASTPNGIDMSAVEAMYAAARQTKNAPVETNAVRKPMLTEEQVKRLWP